MPKMLLKDKSFFTISVIYMKITKTNTSFLSYFFLPKNIW